MDQTSGHPESSGGDDRTRYFLELLGRCDDALQTFVLAMVPDPDAAQDISQEVRLRLWEQFDQFQPDKDFGAWARAIAFHLVRAQRKTKARESARMSDAFLEQIADEFPRSAEEQSSRRRVLQRCLGKLAAEVRTLLYEYYQGRETSEQLGRRWGRTAAAVRQTICRTRHSLEKCVENELQREARR